MRIYVGWINCPAKITPDGSPTHPSPAEPGFRARMSPPSNQDENEQVKRLRRFLRPLARVVLFFGLFNAIVGVAIRNGRFASVGIVLLLYFATTFVARRFRSDPKTALPFWLEFFSVAGGAAATLYLLLFLLWQFTMRLRKTIDRT